MLGAATKLNDCRAESASSTAQRIPSACSSISRISVLKVSASGAPLAIRSSTRRLLSNMAARIVFSMVRLVILELDSENEYPRRQATELPTSLHGAQHP